MICEQVTGILYIGKHFEFLLFKDGRKPLSTYIKEIISTLEEKVLKVNDLLSRHVAMCLYRGKGSFMLGNCYKGDLHNFTWKKGLLPNTQ